MNGRPALLMEEPRQDAQRDQHQRDSANHVELLKVYCADTNPVPHSRETARSMDMPVEMVYPPIAAGYVRSLNLP